MCVSELAHLSVYPSVLGILLTHTDITTWTQRDATGKLSKLADETKRSEKKLQRTAERVHPKADV